MSKRSSLLNYRGKRVHFRGVGFGDLCFVARNAMVSNLVPSISSHDKRSGIEGLSLIGMYVEHC